MLLVRSVNDHLNQHFLFRSVLEDSLELLKDLDGIGLESLSNVLLR